MERTRGKKNLPQLFMEIMLRKNKLNSVRLIWPQPKSANLFSATEASFTINCSLRLVWNDCRIYAGVSLLGSSVLLCDCKLIMHGLRTKWERWSCVCLCVTSVCGGRGYRSIKESCCSYFSSNRRVIISLRLEGEDRVKQNQTNLSTGNYSAHRCPIINSYGPLGFFFFFFFSNYDSSSLCHRSSFKALNLQYKKCR